MSSNFPYNYTPAPRPAPRPTPSEGEAGSVQPESESAAHGVFDPSYEPTAPLYGAPQSGTPYPGYDGQYGQQYGQAYAPGYGQPYPGYPYAGYPYGQYATPVPTPTHQPAHQPKRNGRRWLAMVAAAAVAAGLVVGGVAIADNSGSSSVSGSGTNGTVLPGTGGGTTNGGTDGGAGTFPGIGGSGSGSAGSGSVGGGSIGSGSGSGSNGTTSATIATATQGKGIVTIVSVLGYQNAESAGTGMILTSNGEILTNNHVIDGATSITVTDETTGSSYKAKVVGTDATDDVAVLQLTNASGLTTANLGDSSSLSSGDSIIGVGNAGGTGTLRASAGKVTALNQSITASDETGANAEKLHGLIGVDADIISGDSGGPMYDSAGKIIGMNTAASSTSSAGGVTSTNTTNAYAIPIDNALAIAKQIESGAQTSTIHQGLPGFIGVSVQDANGAGAGITSVLTGGPAAKAGITAGSVITKVDGTTITSGSGLKSALSGKKPGSSVSLTWTGSDGASHTATLTLTTGPAD